MPIEHASSMYVLAYKRACAKLSVQGNGEHVKYIHVCHRSFVHMHADMRAILKRVELCSWDTHILPHAVVDF